MREQSIVGEQAKGSMKQLKAQSMGRTKSSVEGLGMREHAH